MKLPAFLSVLCAALAADLALACPFCEAPDVTLSQQLQQSDVAALVQWVEGKPADREAGFPGSTTYEVVDLVHDSSGTLARGSRFSIERHRPGKPGDLFVMLGSLSTVIEWGSPIEVTETSYNYMKQAPSSEAPRAERLAYFLRFLDFPDRLVSDDAYAEFASAPYQDVAAIKDKLPRDKIRQWVSDPQTPVSRMGLYGLMLGLCGNADDAALMKEKILKPSKEFRIGIEGVMAGLILIEKDKALDLLDEEKLKDKSEPFSEHVAVMQALRFLWTDGKGVVPPDRLRKSMRLLLDTDVADLAINDLARWEDWGVTKELTERYGTPAYDISFIKRNIIRFMLAAEDSAPKDATEVPEYVTIAKEFLKKIETEDPDTFRTAKKFYFR